MAGAVSTFHIIGDADAILLYPYGVAYLDKQICQLSLSAGLHLPDTLPNTWYIRDGSSRARRTFPVASVSSGRKRGAVLGWDIPQRIVGRLYSVARNRVRSTTPAE